MLGADFLRYPRVLAVPHTASGPKNRHACGSVPMNVTIYDIITVGDRSKSKGPCKDV